MASCTRSSRRPRARGPRAARAGVRRARRAGRPSTCASRARRDTLFEGPVTTDVRPFRHGRRPTPSRTVRRRPARSTGDRRDAGADPRLAPSRPRVETILGDVAARSLGVATAATFVDQVARRSRRVDAATSRSAREYDGAVRRVGGCRRPGRTPATTSCSRYGDRQPSALLQLSGPATATPARRSPCTVDSDEPARPSPARRVGGATTGADGTAAVAHARDGRAAARLKATKHRRDPLERASVVRHDGADGVVRDAPRRRRRRRRRPHRPPARRLRSPTQRPRLPLRASSSPRAQPRRRGRRARLRASRDRASCALTRRVGDRCFAFSGKRERFIGDERCGAHGTFFSVGDRADWSLPAPGARWPRGRYVLDVRRSTARATATRAGERGRNRGRVRRSLDAPRPRRCSRSSARSRRCWPAAALGAGNAPDGTRLTVTQTSGRAPSAELEAPKVRARRP